MNRRPVRQILGIAAVGVLALGLAACSTGEPSSCDDLAPSGAASNSVSSDGDLGSAPEIDFPTPLYSDGIQATTLVEGDGAPIQDGQYVSAYLSLINGADGTILSQSSYDQQTPTEF